MRDKWHLLDLIFAELPSIDSHNSLVLSIVKLLLGTSRQAPHLSLHSVHCVLNCQVSRQNLLPLKLLHIKGCNIVQGLA